jgi:hypothetical protein
MDATSAASRAQARAHSFYDEGKLRDAAIYLVNALGHAPSSLAILNEHVSVVLALVEQCHRAGDPEEARSLLDELADRLSRFLEHADPDDVERVQAHLCIVATQRAQMASVPPTDTASEANETSPIPPALRLAEMAAEARTDRWDGSVPDGAEATLARLREVAELVDFIEEDGSPAEAPVLPALRDYREALRAAASADDVCGEAAAAGRQAASGEDMRVVIALLQQSESTLRGLLPGVRRLDERRQRRVLEQLDVTTASLENALAAQRARHSRNQWKEFASKHEVSMKESREWTYSIHSGCKHQIERLQQLSEECGEMLRKLEDEAARAKASKLLREVNELGGRALSAQRDAYNAWALKQIEQCFNRAQSHVKVTGDDEEAMDDEIYKALGPITPGHLPAEVSRAYSEVLEYFLSKLYAPGKDKGFYKQGSRLNLLRRLAQATKTPLSMF